jgi:hypothetical protein
MGGSRFLALVSVTAAGVIAATTAGAAPQAVFLAATPHVVYQGHLLHLRGNAGSCRVGNTVTLISRAFPATHEFAGIPAVFAKVKSGGAFATTTRIPLHRHSGLYGITARCGGGNLGVDAHVRVHKL